jgi:histidinol-phosphate/aromatic aminotransferase/cobyric acid decarboxylase-like protein
MQTYNDFLKLKSESGLHSPSVYEIQKVLGRDIEVDACFLCNPYAFELFMDNYNKAELTDFIKYYPPQNRTLSKNLSKALNINSDYLLIGNGAIQLIELIMREFEGKRKCLVSPTFSSYYEFDIDNITFFKTVKEEDFNIDVDKLVQHCTDNNSQVLVLVNPNNPTGATLSRKDINYITKNLKHTTVIVDESFIDFYNKDQSVEHDVYTNHNLIVIRSLSKDFGIAGLRLGYGVANPKLIKSIFSKYGLCWNINGLAHFFLQLLESKEFMSDYDIARERYISNREEFYKDLKSLKLFKVYDSQANFFILDCGKYIHEVFSKLLFDEGIYTRILNDKLDLEESFLRIACGKLEDNKKVFQALKLIESKYER